LTSGAHYLDATGLARRGAGAWFPGDWKPQCCTTCGSRNPSGRQGAGGSSGNGPTPEFREWFIQFGDSGYLVLYRFDGKLVTILAVRPGKEAGY